MKKKFFIAAFAATVFAATALGMAACSKDSVGGSTGDNGGGNGDGNKSQYTVTLDANGGKFSASETTRTVKTDKSGKITEAPAAPNIAKVNCTFKGWGRTASTKYIVSFPAEFDKDSTIYAVWEETGGDDGNDGDDDTEYTVTFDANGGTFTEDVAPVTRQTVDGRITNAMLPDVTFEGKTLEGWYTAKTGGSLVTTTVFTAAQTVYAVWKDNGGSGGEDNPGGDRNESLTYEAVSGTGAWVVGEIASKDMTWSGGGWDNGFVMERADEPTGNKQYKITVYLEEGDIVKIRYNATAASGDGIGYSQIENGGDLTCCESAASDDNILINESGYFTMYFKFEWDSNKIWLAFSETAPEA